MQCSFWRWVAKGALAPLAWAPLTVTALAEAMSVTAMRAVVVAAMRAVVVVAAMRAVERSPDLVLRNAFGNPVVDPDWDEMLIDVGTPQKRAAVAAIIGGWIDGCASAGYHAIEIDNLDSFSRSGGLLSEADAVAAMRLFADRADAKGLPIAQKNSAELVGQRTAMGTDFAIAEECNRYSECDVYTGAYGEHVLVIEYRRRDFDAGCSAFPGLSIVLRDLELVSAGSGGYVFDDC